mmetsp:Transcript_5916/g.17790  ORF Transcript_5916/g.17790 Transcript_5916/m.17790 type:complete len:133 (+) Transcript_5916:63-461(+)
MGFGKRIKRASSKLKSLRTGLPRVNEEFSGLNECANSVLEVCRRRGLPLELLPGSRGRRTRPDGTVDPGFMTLVCPRERCRFKVHAEERVKAGHRVVVVTEVRDHTCRNAPFAPHDTGLQYAVLGMGILSAS